MTTNAAEQLLKLLPSSIPLTVTPGAQTADAQSVHPGEAFTATFVGSTSADITLVIKDLSVLPSDGLDLSDVVTPAIEAAAKTIGAGVLSAVSTGGTVLFGDPEADTYTLTGNGVVLGYIAIRIRANSSATSAGDVTGKLNRINDVEMAMTVEIGHTRMTVKDLLSLEPGAVVELDRSAGAPADIKLNGKLIAHGEVVVVDQDYAVRVTRIIKDEDTAN
ncbi:flagellar motor switch protein FliN [Leifsonia sp. Leaf264]|uniref:flagellar motor switch protein FliN n=1 Tax=Leifsonia sp. Leaf264 TaxID=1736314 RepID=UPI0009EA2334|nr:flagellar motor switch protein FliN [Leifsonia sp. Leaf264]